ncbi:microfibril-associated glycoprotein 4-like isoform X2 [Rhinatrema bivittatum]|nr:microfibril-associated glycoprotein 4-like isoform X2 [Rhinatrema bivittatum]XP_029462737.1 microfibril-associated glycoprotein 4-like isoform X2 [Rhinatrema bivittatum]
MSKKVFTSNIEYAGLPLDCEDFLRRGSTTSGVYVIYPRGPTLPVPVYCDMTSNSEGWTVFQKRSNGSVDFSRDWKDYRDGFGHVNTEYWLGLENIWLMTLQRDYKLRVDLEGFDNQRVYAEYAVFSLSPYALHGESDGYTLHVSGFRDGGAGDSLSNHSGQRFSTFDRDQDGDYQNCAEYIQGGFWYHANGCYHANLNGCYEGYLGSGLSWHSWTSTNHSLKFTQMKIKAASKSDWEKPGSYHLKMRHQHKNKI